MVHYALSGSGSGYGSGYGSGSRFGCGCEGVFSEFGRLLAADAVGIGDACSAALCLAVAMSACSTLADAPPR